jgi:hypothetical protein
MPSRHDFLGGGGGISSSDLCQDSLAFLNFSEIRSARWAIDMTLQAPGFFGCLSREGVGFLVARCSFMALGPHQVHGPSPKPADHVPDVPGDCLAQPRLLWQSRLSSQSGWSCAFRPTLGTRILPVRSLPALRQRRSVGCRCCGGPARWGVRPLCHLW